MIGDKGFAGREFEPDMTDLSIAFARPRRRNETRRHDLAQLDHQRTNQTIPDPLRPLKVQESVIECTYARPETADGSPHPCSCENHWCPACSADGLTSYRESAA